jgi:hypothetical protein
MVLIGLFGAIALAADSQQVEPPAPWSDQLMRQQCESAPLEMLGARSEQLSVFDHGTGQTVVLDAREACLQRVALTPDPRGDMKAQFFFKDGVFQAIYFDITREVVRDASGRAGETVTQSKTPIPEEEAQLRLAAQKASQR